MQKVLKEGPSRRRVGLIVDGAPARRASILPHQPKSEYLTLFSFLEGAKIFAPSGSELIGLSACQVCEYV